ncbi:MAG: ABC transporter substrate-binding protein [Clostridia bacterium]|nr:ABC transporter substrate-binding protein [Clostridia bacterium]
MKKTMKLLAVAALILSLTFVCFAETAQDNEKVRVGALKGPTGMAFAHLVTANPERYAFNLVATPAEVNALVISGQVDIAAVPINAGAVLYSKTEKNVQALSLITRGMLYVLEKGDTIHSVSDLEGKTICTAGQGATPDYVMNYILDTAGVSAALDFQDEHATAASLGLEGKADILLLPEPMVTNVLMKSEDFRVALDITEEFAAAARQNGREEAQLSMSVVIVRKEYAQEHPDQVAAFLRDLEASIAFANENVAEAAQEIAELGIIPAAKVAERALPSCRLVFVAGEEMQSQASPLYEILFSANPASVGGQIPDDGYYFK